MGAGLNPIATGTAGTGEWIRFIFSWLEISAMASLSASEVRRIPQVTVIGAGNVGSAVAKQILEPGMLAVPWPSKFWTVN